MNVPRLLRLILVLSCIAGTSLLAIASCIGPMIKVSVPSASPGEKVTVTGIAFTDGCHDVGFNGVFPPTYPAKGVKILFVQAGKTQEVGRGDADKHFEILISLNVPAGATAGDAEIVAETLYENRLLKTRPIALTVK